MTGRLITIISPKDIIPSPKKDRVIFQDKNNQEKINRLLNYDLKTNEIKEYVESLPFNNYYFTLRNKLMWGVDKRN